MNSTHSFGKLEKRECFLTDFVRISLPDNKNQRKKIQMNVFYEYRCKIQNKILYCITVVYKKRVTYIMTKWSLSEGCKIGCMFKKPTI